ncbi:hypothetical protein ACJJIU_08360 [Microbulbifer sp. CnH-101-E]|uniref:hypothetical protein n=1 Tax=unclassified Microbulbifer TaxID=2619833 RepID=UPI004039F571
MKFLTQLFTVTTLLSSIQALAHDPSLHKEKAVKPDCAAMQGMDHSKMDVNDPVLKAMRKKCGEHMQHDKHIGHEGDHHDHSDKNDPQ